MTKKFKITIGLFIAAVLCWVIACVYTPQGFEIWLLLSGAFLSLATVCFLVVSIVDKFAKSISPYKVFAIVDTIIGLGVAAYAVYDIKTDTGWFAGLFGALLLMFVVPMAVILLIADLAVWLYNKKRAERKEQEI